MAKLSAAARKKLPASQFALSKGRFPIPDRGHAVAAERLAPRSEKAGNITHAQEQKVIAKAKRKLGKGKTPTAINRLAG